MFRLLLPVRSEVEKVVHRMPEILFAAEIAFRVPDNVLREPSQRLLQLAASCTAMPAANMDFESAASARSAIPA